MPKRTVLTTRELVSLAQRLWESHKPSPRAASGKTKPR